MSKVSVGFDRAADASTLMFHADVLIGVIVNVFAVADNDDDAANTASATPIAREGDAPGNL